MEGEKRTFKVENEDEEEFPKFMIDQNEGEKDECFFFHNLGIQIYHDTYFCQKLKIFPLYSKSNYYTNPP